MRLEANGRNILDVTRVKAKQYEFSIEEEFHSEFEQSPERLLVLTIGILGELVALEARQSDDRDQIKQSLKEQLVLVGQYFESMSMARLLPATDEYLRILSSVAYYLADMPGSSLILARSVSSNPDGLTDSKLERFLVWLLKSKLSSNFDLAESGAYNHQVRGAALVYRGFINSEADLHEVEDELSDLRALVYSTGTDRELLLADIVVALIKRKIENSSLICLPKYTGLHLDYWKQALANDRFVKEFWPGQRLVGELGVLRGASAVMQLPTSAGKTKSAELIIQSGFLSGRAKLAIVVAPFRALCREISQGFMHTFEYDLVNVNELRDITNVDSDEQEFLKFLLGEAYKGKHDRTIIVSTPEKLVYLLRHEPSLAEKIDLLIFDEGHQFDSGKRGVTYELLIASLKETCPPAAQKVLISAVMPNAQTIGEWLNGERGVNIQGANRLPSVKSVAFLSWITDMGQLSYLDQDNKYDSGLYVPKIIQQLNLGRRGRERKDYIFPVRDKIQSISCYLGLKLCHQGPVAIFCGDKRSIITHCKTVVQAFDRGLPSPKPSEISDKQELAKIAFLSNLHFSDNHIFSKAILLGVLPHSSTVPNGIRTAIEWAMNKKLVRLVVCTSTLAQGVNLPIKYLLVSNVMQGGRRISTRDFQNLIGRAGRSGYHTEGAIIFTDPSIYDGRHSWKGRFKWSQTLALLDFNNTEDCLSSLMKIITPFTFGPANNDLLEFIGRPSARQAEWRQWGVDNNIDVAELMTEMDLKMQTLSAVESYFLSMLKEDDSLLRMDDFLRLARGTLAFHLADDDEKERLLIVFEIIHSRLQAVSPDKLAYYGKTLLGLDQIKFIEEWLDDNIWELELCNSPHELLDVCWSLILELSTAKIISGILPYGESVNIAKRWCSGDSYQALFSYAIKNDIRMQANTKTRTLNQEHIVDFCSALSYDGMMLVGGLADIIEGRSMSDDILIYARSLQNYLKFGLSDELHIWLYGQGFSDREVSKHIAAEVRTAEKGSDIFDYNILKDNKKLLDDALLSLPSVYSEVKIC